MRAWRRRLAAASFGDDQESFKKMLNDPAEIAGTDCGGGGIEVGPVWNRNGKRDWERAGGGSGNGGAGGGVAGSGAGGGTGAVTYSGVETELVVGNVFGTGSGSGFGSGYGVGGGNGTGAGPGMAAGPGGLGGSGTGIGSGIGTGFGVGQGGGRGSGTGHGLGEPTDDEIYAILHALTTFGKVGSGANPAAAAVEFQGQVAQLPARAQDVLRNALAGIAEQGKNTKLDQSMLVKLAEHLSIRFALERFERGRSEGERGAADAGPHEPGN